MLDHVKGTSVLKEALSTTSLGAAEPVVVATCTRIHTLITEWHVPSVEAYEQLDLEVLRVEVE